MTNLNKVILRYLFKRNLTQYVCVSRNKDIGCMQIIPWGDRISYQTLIKTINNCVVIVGEDLWINMNNKIEDIIYVVISDRSTISNNRGLMSDYTIPEDEIFELFYIHPELLGNRVCILGNSTVLFNTVKYTKTFVIQESQRITPANRVLSKYPIELVDTISKIESIESKHHINGTEFRTEVRKIKRWSRLNFNYFYKKYIRNNTRIVTKNILEQL